MSPTPVALVHVESPQTAVPTRVVEPGRARHIAVAAPPLPAAALQRRTRVVLYYRTTGGGAVDGGGSQQARLWEEAWWAKESLGEALADHPEMAGRLRRHRADGSWEVKLIDAGVRFVQATADATLDEFVAAARDDRDRARCWEAALAPWADVNAEDPDICALFYMQLTRFHGDGGYAIGVSCSLMLSDPLSLARFLRSWARTHAGMKARNELATHPLMQYASYFKHPMAARTLTKSIPLDGDAFSGAADGHAAETTVLFRARPNAGAGAPAPDDHRALAGACVAQASERLGVGKAPAQFSVVVVADGDDGPGGTTVETCTADGQPESGGGGRYKLQVAQWQEELGLAEMVLRDTKPVHVSFGIVSVGDEGLVVMMPDGDAGEFLVATAIPK